MNKTWPLATTVFVTQVTKRSWRWALAEWQKQHLSETAVPEASAARAWGAALGKVWLWATLQRQVSCASPSRAHAQPDSPCRWARRRTHTLLLYPWGSCVCTCRSQPSMASNPMELKFPRRSEPTYPDVLNSHFRENLTSKHATMLIQETPSLGPDLSPADRIQSQGLSKHNNISKDKYFPLSHWIQ